MVHLIGLDGCHRACEIVLLGHTITDDHDIVQGLGIILQRDDGTVGGCHLLRSHTDVSNGDLCTGGYINGIVTVEVGNTHRLTVGSNGGTHDRLAGSIFHLSLDGT